MSMIRTFTMLAALTASTAAYADKPAPPPAKPADKPVAKPADKPAAPKTALSEAEAQRFYAFFDKLVAAVVTNKDDCVKMAAAVNAHIDASQALLKDANDAKAAGKELPQSVKDKIAKKSTDELLPAMKAKCAGDKAVGEAFMRLKPPGATPGATK
jgi:hypothetical protein